MKKEVSLNSKNNKVKVIILIASTLIAVGSISYGIYSISKKSKGEAGWNTYKLNYDSTYTFYYQNMYLDYYFSKGEEASKSGKVTNYFTESSKYIYSLIDSNRNNESKYNVKGIGYINSHPNEEIEIEKTLYDILVDAKEKTLENSSYSMFSGFLYDYWASYQVSKLYKINTSYINAIVSLINEKDNFTLNLLNKDNKYYCFYSYSDKVSSFINDYRLKNDSALNLNTLFYSYYVDGVASKMIDAGYNNGTVYSHTGEKIYMNQNFLSNNQIKLYDSKNNKPYVYANYNNMNYSIVSEIRTFPVNLEYEAEFCYKFVEGSEIWDKKNLFYSSLNGYSSQIIRSSTLITSDKEITLPDLTYMNLKYVHEGKVESIANFGEKVASFSILDSEEDILHTNSNNEYLELLDNGENNKYKIVNI